MENEPWTDLLIKVEELEPSATKHDRLGGPVEGNSDCDDSSYLLGW
jgi:hypothetical protein